MRVMDWAEIVAIDPEEMTLAESTAWRKLRWVWCKICGGGSICNVGWGHKKQQGHEVISLKDVGKLDEATREFLFCTGEGNQLSLL